MISYFRSILPSRLILLVLLFVAIQLPLVLWGMPGTAPELLHMLVGERMAGGFAMYHDIYDNTAPLSALVFWLVDVLAGRSFLAYRLTAQGLLLLQALRFNATLNRHNVYATKDYLPALLYLVLGSISFELNMLTPLLIGNTFIILSLPYIITLSKEGFDNNRLFVGGFMLGMAALSYLPLAVFLLVGAFAILFFASSTFRSMLLMFCGFLFPYAVLVTYYLYTDTTQEFLELHLLRPWHLKVAFLRPPADDVATLMAIPAALLLLSLLSVASLPQRLVFQVKFQQLMWVWLFTSLLVIFTRAEISVATFILVLPPVAYFGEFFFTSHRKRWLLNLAMLLVLASVLVLRYRLVLGINRFLLLDESPLLLQEQRLPMQAATVLVLGNDVSYYAQNRPITPYINWELAQRHFGRLNEYQAVFEIYQNFRKEMPAYIVDKANLMPELKYKLPAIFGKYGATGTPGVYQFEVKLSQQEGRVH